MRCFCLLMMLSFFYTQAIAQAFAINSFFSEYPAITFYTPDSNNFIYDEVQNFDDLKRIIAKDCPFSVTEAEHLDGIIPFAIQAPILGLHNQVPNYDTVLQEVYGTFAIDTFVRNWYAYYNHSLVDTTVAFLIIPGTGIHNGWHIAAGDTGYYHNVPSPIKDKCLAFGDVYTYVKPNEDFRGIWKDIGGSYMKLDYNYFTPYTDLHGNSWAANMQIECTAIVKCLKLKYNKVIVLGLSNAGIPALIAAIEGNANGVNCASGLSVTDYDGFSLTNFENPFYYNLFKKYSLDSIKLKMQNTSTYYLFSYGDGDCCTNYYEYNTHILQDTFSTLSNPCHIDFTYNFNGHHFPIAYLDTFFTKVIQDTCAPFALTSPSVNTQHAKISIFPIPSNRTLFIQSEIEELQSVQLFTLEGIECVSKKQIQSKKTSIDLPVLASGNYIVNITGKHSHYAQLISIQQ